MVVGPDEEFYLDILFFHTNKFALIDQRDSRNGPAKYTMDYFRCKRFTNVNLMGPRHHLISHSALAVQGQTLYPSAAEDLMIKRQESQASVLKNVLAKLGLYNTGLIRRTSASHTDIYYKR
jgi:hypothetical protein